MNEIIFKNIEVKNFLSFGNLPIKLDFNRDLNFVSGYNLQTQSTNGVGKTALFYNAILFALFGESFRLNIKQNNLINYYNKKNMYVSLSLIRNDKEIFIYRGKNPNEFYYIVDGEKFQNDNMNATQENLSKVLDISEDLFTNIFIINAGENIDFIKSEGSVKLKERFEKIFFKDVIFKKVLEYSRKELNVVEKALNNNKGKIEEKILFLKKIKLLLEENNEISKKESEIIELEKELIELEKINIEDKSNKIKLINNKKNELLNSITKLKSNIIHLQSSIKEINEMFKYMDKIENHCPLCFNELNNDQVENIKNKYNDSVKENESAIMRLNNEYNDCNIKLNKLKEFEIKLNRDIDDIKYKKLDIKGKINELSAYLKNNNTKIKNEYENTRKEAILLKKAVNEMEIEKDDLEFIGVIFNNSGGILDYFIKNVLVLLNDIIEKYIKRLNLDFSFYFNADLKLCFDVHDTLNLSNFSSGEIKLINFCVFFALLEFFYVTMGVKSSIIVIDEVMDTTVSSIKLEIIFQILKEIHIQHNVGMYLLSHDISGSNNNILNFKNIIELEKVNGFTIVKEKEVKNE